MGWDLKVFSFLWQGFCIGGGVSITTPMFKLRYTDAKLWRCLTCAVSFMGCYFGITIPLWKESDAV